MKNTSTIKSLNSLACSKFVFFINKGKQILNNFIIKLFSQKQKSKK